MTRWILALAATVWASTAVQAEMLDRSRLRETFSYQFKDFKTPSAEGTDNQSGPWTTVFGYAPGRVGNHTLPANHELQLYVDPQFKGTGEKSLGLDPFEQGPDGLSLVAKEIPPAQRATAWNFRYMSGLLTTRRSFSQKYGYFELRVRVPGGKGLWPAFWLVPVTGQWPPEIDVFEICCKDAKRFSGAVHWSTDDKPHLSDGKFIDTVDLSRDFHVFGVSWTEKELCWYLDDEKKFCLPTPAQANMPMYMLINLAIAGNPPDAPDRTTPFPARMTLDYVRAFDIEAQ